MKTKLTTLLLIFTFITSSYATRYYVNINATGSNSGTNWTNAFNDLQVALSVAINNDEIWVATGFYKATSSTNRDLSFVMRNGVNLYGGFNGTETDIDQRDINLNPTTLSGDIGQLGDNSDNTRKIIKIQNFTEDFTLDGFRIISGYDWSSSGKGAGIYCISNTGAQIMIKNCIFYNNASYHSGGAMLIKDSNVTFNNCEFSFNSSYNYGGGAIYCANGSDSNLYFNETKFIGNTSRTGAVINFDGYVLNLDRCLITNNTSSSTGGNIINISDANNFIISNSLIAGNFLNGSTANLLDCYSNTNDTKELINVTICHNQNSSTVGPHDELIYNPNGRIDIYNSIIYENYLSATNSPLNGVNAYNSIIGGGWPFGSDILDANPLFVNPSNLSSAPFDASNFDYSIQTDSPAINYGNNSYVSSYQFDYLNNNRIQQDIVDCGAFESPYTLSIHDLSSNENDLIYISNSNEIIIQNFDKYINSMIYVYSINGKECYKSMINTPRIKLELSQGIYIIKVDNYKTKKIIIK